MAMVYVRCTRCKQLIDVGGPGACLLRRGKLARIRCLEEGCLSADWYSEAEFEGTEQPEEVPQAEVLVPAAGQSKTHWYDLLTSGT